MLAPGPITVHPLTARAVTAHSPRTHRAVTAAMLTPARTLREQGVCNPYLQAVLYDQLKLFYRFHKKPLKTKLNELALQGLIVQAWKKKELEQKKIVANEELRQQLAVTSV